MLTDKEKILRYLSKSGGIIVLITSVISFLFERKIVNIIVGIMILIWITGWILMIFTMIALKKQKTEKSAMKEKDILIDEIAYKLRLCVQKRISEKIKHKNANADWKYEKQENFTLFLYGGEMYIDIFINEQKIKAKVFITRAQDIFIDMPDVISDYETEKNDGLQALNEIKLGNEDIIDDSDYDLSLWLNSEGIFQMQSIFSENKITEFYVDFEGEAFNGFKKFGKINGFPNNTKWDELIYHLGIMDVESRIIDDCIRICIE